MKILALQTNPKRIKENFLVEGEKELATTIRHGFLFLTECLLPMGFFLLSTAALTTVALTIPDETMAVSLEAWGLLVCLTIVGLAIMRAYIDWRYHFIFITSEKIVIVHHWLLFQQIIRPIHLQSIASTTVASRFFSIGNCGILYLHLGGEEESGGGTVTIDYVRSPNALAGIVDNALILVRQRSRPRPRSGDDRILEEQQQESIREKAEEAVAPPAEQDS